ncbi:MAG: hypothetical protein J07HQX50_01470 [Haloquadratum sp. J07HQX50]|nr:MAG: hypothetical protein J07HQX50_01470 [Haloquadratum sp. J07HQX50]
MIPLDLAVSTVVRISPELTTLQQALRAQFMLFLMCRDADSVLTISLGKCSSGIVGSCDDERRSASNPLLRRETHLRSGTIEQDTDCHKDRPSSGRYFQLDMQNNNEGLLYDATPEARSTYSTTT